MNPIHQYNSHEYRKAHKGDGSLAIALVMFGIAAVALAVLVLINR